MAKQKIRVCVKVNSPDGTHKEYYMDYKDFHNSDLAKNIKLVDIHKYHDYDIKHRYFVRLIEGKTSDPKLNTRYEFTIHYIDLETLVNDFISNPTFSDFFKALYRVNGYKGSQDECKTISTLPNANKDFSSFAKKLLKIIKKGYGYLHIRYKPQFLNNNSDDYIVTHVSTYLPNKEEYILSFFRDILCNPTIESYEHLFYNLINVWPAKIYDGYETSSDGFRIYYAQPFTIGFSEKWHMCGEADYYYHEQRYQIANDIDDWDNCEDPIEDE